MARDYAKKKPEKKSIPGWLWLLAGLSIGLFAAFLVYLNKIPVTPSATQPAVKTAKAAVRALQDKVEKTVEETVSEGFKFDFYSILPEFEVLIPKAEGEKKQPLTPVAEPGQYMLQAGSFRNAGDADTRKAQLALLGIVSSIQTVTINGKDTWHRVRIGPYQDLEPLNKVRKLLNESGIEFIVTKIKS